MASECQHFSAYLLMSLLCGGIAERRAVSRFDAIFPEEFRKFLANESLYNKYHPPSHVTGNSKTARPVRSKTSNKPPPLRISPPPFE